MLIAEVLVLNPISSHLCYLILILPLGDEIVDSQQSIVNRQQSTVNSQPSTVIALVD